MARNVIIDEHDVARVVTALAREQDKVKALEERARWRPISEMHEDFGQCILINLADPGNLVIGNNLDDWFDADDWTHFAQVPSLTHEEATRLAAEMESQAPREHK